RVARRPGAGRAAHAVGVVPETALGRDGDGPPRGSARLERRAGRLSGAGLVLACEPGIVDREARPAGAARLDRTDLRRVHVRERVDPEASEKAVAVRVVGRAHAGDGRVPGDARDAATHAVGPV